MIQFENVKKVYGKTTILKSRDLPDARDRRAHQPRIKNLASIYSELASQLLNIESNIKDLLLPFQKGYYYNSLMGGSFSIKSVLPAIFPNDKSLDYKNLEGVQNGSEAMYIFHTLEYMNEGEQQIARKNLLKYCELDTYAMVKIWHELRRVAGRAIC